jgi:hypothetical protein
MSYSTAGHKLGQVSTVDVEAITALYVDSVAAYVDHHTRRAGVESATRAAAERTGAGGAATWEDARQQRATRLGVSYLPPADVQSNLTTDLQTDTDCLRTDGELARICAIGFKQYHLYQRWVTLHHATRQTGKQGFTYAEFDALMLRYGVKGCDTYNTRLLRNGDGFYWRLHDGMIYPTGYVALCKRAIQHAHVRGLHDLYLYGNHPGQRRDMYISVSGSGADFEGAVLSAWYGAHGCPTISRHTLEVLLYRDARSIRRMEKRACIRITYNEAQTTDPAAVPLKADGSLRGDVTYKNGVWSSRMPNTYTPRMTRQHPYKGQGRKASCWFKHWLSSNRLPGDQGAEGLVIDKPFGKLNSIGRNYCESAEALKASRKRGCKRVLHVATGRQRKGRVWDVDAQYPDI